MLAVVIPALNEVPCHEYIYSGGILNIGIRCRWVLSFTPGPLDPRGKSPQ